MGNQEALVLRNRIIGVLLRDARVRADKTKRECGAALGVSAGVITAYEEGRKFISMPELEVLAFFLDVPITHFWDEQAHLLAEERLPPLREIMGLRHRIVGALLRQARMETGKTQKELAQLIGCPPSRISSYEYGEKPIPLVELEVLAPALNRPLIYFLDEQSGPVGEWEKEQAAYRAFLELPDEVRDFIVKPINQSYLRVAMKLSDMPADSLRTIAEGLLEITL
jgi:transcriptional regulator with XRE-family HTH domain